MATNVIYFKGSRAEAKAMVRRSVAMLSGRVTDDGIKKGVALAVGMACLSDVKDAFIEKARGGTGKDGVTWEPLKPATIAARRVRARDLKLRPDIKDREKEIKKRVKKLVGYYLVSMPPAMALATARRVAQRQITAETGKSALFVYGGRDVEILRDTGILFNSLSPGQINGDGATATYTKPSEKGGDQQILEVLDNGLIVGTNVPYAAVHQHGSRKKGIPARPFLPVNGNVPAIWWDRWLKVAREAMAAGIRMAFQVRR